VWFTRGYPSHLDGEFSTLAAAVVRVAVNAVGEDAVNGRPIWSGRKLIAVGRALVLVRAGLTTVNRLSCQDRLRADPRASGWVQLVAGSGSPDPLSCRATDRTDQSTRKLKVNAPALRRNRHPSLLADRAYAASEIRVRVEGPDRKAGPQSDSTP
jgi:hypothetical protein